MKLCMPTQGDKGLDERVLEHFGSAAFFTLYDTETGAVRAVANRQIHHAHGACRPLAAISGLGVDAVLTSGMGRRAVQRLNEGGIKVFRLAGETVREAAARFAAGGLAELTPADACGGHG